MIAKPPNEPQPKASSQSMFIVCCKPVELFYREMISLDRLFAALSSAYATAARSSLKTKVLAKCITALRCRYPFVGLLSSAHTIS